MEDDNMQGILFSKSEMIRFREVSSIHASTTAKANKKTKKYPLNHFLARRFRSRNRDDGGTSLGNFIEYVVITKEK